DKLTNLHQQILEYGTTKEGADDAKAKSEAILEKRRTDRLTARKKMATDLVKRWSVRVEDGWDVAVKQYNEVEKLLKAANDNYVSAQKNLANAARPYEQANANLRSARASMNAQAIAAAASDVQRYEPAFQAATSAESKAKSKLADVTRRYERTSRSMAVRAATAANFNRSFSFRFRDILDSDPAIATQFNGLKAKQLALDYDRFAPKPVDASQLSDRARAKMRQMELALRIPISIDDILEVAKDHAKNSEQ
ncbi:MAG: hypothetical protein RIS70_3707, partial [Planctomycetota bacterium]